ncbi:nucleotidyl cyclase domain-containing protein [Glycomyces dulcitolivorans]|uniref:adenylate/guanylate cyclase domain-containing protein n=1 Tax=Glycomyces dulcitolivorans TaxID=2200759 RepID=UPI000DD37A93|nr:adenylate/guanylate cyclase domain-containing protein [Glycomyces dulcitolivorans]
MSDSQLSQAEDRYLTVLALDIERFGRFTDAQSTRIASSFRDAVEQAFERSGLADTYTAHAFMQNQGDGIVAGFDESRLPLIVDRLPNALQSSLRELHLRDGSGVRMRMGISYGPVQGIADRRVDVAPNRTVVDACRIADAEATRQLLRRSDPEATFLAAALTASVFDFTVARNPLWLRLSEFIEADITIEEKDYRATAFLHVPSPSGELLREGLLCAEETEPEPHVPLEERVERPAGHYLRGDVKSEGGVANMIGSVGGGLQQNDIGPVSGPGAMGVVNAGTVNQTHVAGDQSTAGRDVRLNQVPWEQGDGKHRRTPEGWEHP